MILTMKTNYAKRGKIEPPARNFRATCAHMKNHLAH